MTWSIMEDDKMDSKNVSAGKPMIGGAVYVAPFGTDLPTSVTDTLNSAFVDLGFLSDAGLVNDGSRTSNAIKAWGGETVLNIQAEKNDIWTFTMIESKNVNVLKQVFGTDNVTVDNDTDMITITVNSKQLAAYSWVFDILLSDGSAKRCVLPYAQITTVGSVTYSDSAAIGYETTLNALPDSDGNTHYEYIGAAPGGTSL